MDLSLSSSSVKDKKLTLDVSLSSSSSVKDVKPMDVKPMGLALKTLERYQHNTHTHPCNTQTLSRYSYALSSNTHTLAQYPNILSMPTHSRDINSLSILAHPLNMHIPSQYTRTLVALTHPQFSHSLPILTRLIQPPSQRIRPFNTHSLISEHLTNVYTFPPFYPLTRAITLTRTQPFLTLTLNLSASLSCI